MSDAFIEAKSTGHEPNEQLTNKPFFAFLHFYQPPRSILRPDGRTISVVPQINEEIFQQCYQPLLVEGWAIKPGVVFSLYPSLRSWIKKNHPGEWEKIKTNIDNLPDKEYAVVGDSLIHSILPLHSLEDQKILIAAGKQSFKKDFSFDPKGIWLPEGAVSIETLRIAVEAGYEFVVLKDNQLTKTNHNPSWVELGNGSRIAVVFFSGNTTDIVANQPEKTNNGDNFLKKETTDQGLSFGVDGETFNHHLPNKHYFLDYIITPTILEKNNLIPLNIKSAIANLKDDEITEIKENSSWSCPHAFGRWTGEEKCNCDNPSPEILQQKQIFYQTLKSYNEKINALLEEKVGDSWKDQIINLLVELSDIIFTGGDFISIVRNKISGQELQNLFLAKIYAYLGMTSCSWFFGGADRPERAIPAESIEVIKSLI